MLNIVHTLCIFTALLAAAQEKSDIKPDESIIFFPTFGWKTAEGGWECAVHGWIYEAGPERSELESFRKAIGLGEDDDDDGEQADPKVFGDRAFWFLVDNEGDKEIVVRLDDRMVAMPLSGDNGHFERIVPVPDDAPNAAAKQDRSALRVRFHAVTNPDDSRTFEGVAYLLDDRGLSVVSDIDDTIKITNVRDDSEKLRNTFLREYRPVPGMAELYREWEQRDHAAFHYVSASPWQLYPPLNKFMNSEDFPSGTFHLKDFRWKDSTFFNLFESPVKYKLEQIRPIIERYPQRRFVLIGDSTEGDPEAYAELARKLPQCVAMILIRAVPPDKPGDERFEKIFDGLPRNLWKVYENAAEIRDIEFAKED